MNNTVIKVENLSKQYRLGLVGTGSLGHDLNRWWAILRGKSDPYLKIGESNDRSQKGSSEYVWALKDINFEVKRGEVLGIIGRNGAGKSTLLKILSRVTAPTIGNVKVKGRIASLLEVGTGFHPELTGRENIYLNGALNGMTKAEVTKKLDEIVDFSGCERYIDTPVKRYSSGMTVRLGFSVAAHLEPEILIVDEVLAVGDAEFQKKCIGKMQDVAEHGRTVLFVSHNMVAVQNLCKNGISLKYGKIDRRGGIKDIIKHYLDINKDKAEKSDLSEINNRKGEGGALIKELSICENNIVMLGEDANFEITVEAFKIIEKPILYLGFFDENDVEIVHLNSNMSSVRFEKLKNIRSFKCTIPDFPLTPGSYRISVGILDGRSLIDFIEFAGLLNVKENDFYGVGYLGPAKEGKVILKHTWSIGSLY